MLQKTTPTTKKSHHSLRPATEQALGVPPSKKGIRWEGPGHLGEKTAAPSPVFRVLSLSQSAQRQHQKEARQALPRREDDEVADKP